MFGLYLTQNGPPVNIHIYNVIASERRVNVSQEPLVTITPAWVNVTDALNEDLRPIVLQYLGLPPYFGNQNYYGTSSVWLRTRTMNAEGGITLFDVVNEVYASPVLLA